MTAAGRVHDAQAQRGQYGDRHLWRAVCPDCEWRKGANGKEHAAWLAFTHQAERLANLILCSCFHPEYPGEADPDRYPCAVDELKELLKSRTAA